MTVGLLLFFVGDAEYAVSSASEISMTDDESSDKWSFLAIVLPALLSSLIGGVCSRVMIGGRAGIVAVGVEVLLSVGILDLDRNFMSPRVMEMLARVGSLGRWVDCAASSWKGGYCRGKISSDRASEVGAMTSSSNVGNILRFCTATSATSQKASMAACETFW